MPTRTPLLSARDHKEKRERVREREGATDLDRRLLQVTDVGSRLTRFESHHDLLWVDGAECVDYNFALDRLDRVDYYCYCSRIELFKGL